MSEILHVITGLGEGGAEGALTRLVLADATHRHAVISLSDFGKYGARLTAHGIPVSALGMPRGRVTASGLWRLWRLMRESDATVVQTWMYHADLLGGLAARAAGKRAVAWGIRNAYLDPRTISRSTRLVAKACALLSGRVPMRIVSCSRHAAETHAAIGYRSERMVVIPNGYDVDRIMPDPSGRAALREEWGIADGTVLYGMVARWDPQKDHANLIGAMSRLARTATRDWACVLIGAGMDRANTSLMAQITSSGVGARVHPLGARDDIPRVMSALDFHVLSSAGEAFPNVVAEAMAAGTPCVVTDVGDAGLIVGDTGWVVPPRDSDALAAALGQTMDASTASADRRGAAARARIVEEFGLQRMVSSYSCLWTALEAEAR